MENILINNQLVRQCFMLKLFIIFYLYDFERLELKDISFVLNEKEDIVWTYYQICKVKTSLDKKVIGGIHEEN